MSDEALENSFDPESGVSPWRSAVLGQQADISKEEVASLLPKADGHNCRNSTANCQKAFVGRPAPRQITRQSGN
jgi:hypothetical protein